MLEVQPMGLFSFPIQGAPRTLPRGYQGNTVRKREGLFMRNTHRQLSTQEYLRLIGVPDLPPLTSPFDPGYDPVTFESHLDQSAHLMASIKVSMACWQIANEAVTRRKLAVARSHDVPTVTGGGPFEVAVAQGQLEAYLDRVQTWVSRASNAEKASLSCHSSRKQ